MDIVTFARLHGVTIDRLVEDGKWHRVPTVSHPKKRNGAYMSRGVYGFVQDHATMTEPTHWQPDANEVKNIDHTKIAQLAKEAAERIRSDQEAAARKAGWMMHQSVVTTHAYLTSKGFPDECAHVFQNPEGHKLLLIPMRVDGKIVGVQRISDQPGHEKRFLYGQRTSEAVYVIDNKGPKFFVEGYATGLSVRAALVALKARYTIFVCFTAGNLLRVAKNHGEGIVIADNDKPCVPHPAPGGHGLEVAKSIGLPYWLSDREAEDFNDFEQRAGLFRASQSLKQTMMKGRS